MDLKGFGYLVSTVSVILLGIAAWPKPDEAMWKAIVVSFGMAASVGGMALRFVSHLNEKRDVEAARREARDR